MASSTVLRNKKTALKTRVAEAVATTAHVHILSAGQKAILCDSKALLSWESWVMYPNPRVSSC